MQYILCPRCKFRVPLQKHICTTCGYVVPSLTPAKAVTDELGSKAQKNGFWRQVLGLTSAVEEPANESSSV